MTVSKPDTAPVKTQHEVRAIPIDQLEPSPNNPRRTWTKDKDDVGHTSLERLAQSIREQGILQPLVVIPHNGKYHIVCGERRFRAVKEHTDLKEVPCVVRTDLDDKNSLEVSLTENLQREDLSPMDTAHAYNELITKCGYTARAIAKKLGVSPAAISQRLSLLKLSPELQSDVHQGKLTESQGTAIAHAVNKQPIEKRQAALRDIKHKVDVARSRRPKLDTKDVKTIAKATATRKPKPKIAPATPKELKAMQAFFMTLDRVRAQLKTYEILLKSAPARRRHAELLLLSHKDSAERIHDSVTVLAKIFDEIKIIEREQKVA